ncbi:MAG: response regulator transcription factor [Candidatus Eisenbacteria bacterium]
MSHGEPIVFVVDDDPSVRKSLRRLLAASGLRVEVFGSAHEFLEKDRGTAFGCLVLDVRLPGLNGLELQQTLAKRDCYLPIVFITGHGNIPMSVQAMKAGAVDFLTKPFSPQKLVTAVELGLEKSRQELARRSEITRLRERLSTLSPRESEVLLHVAAGKLNKQIAADLGIAEKTVKVHRGRVMHKLKVQSVAELVRLVEKLGLSLPRAMP